MLNNVAQVNTIGAALSRSVRKNAASVALKFEDRLWTYQELDQAVNKVANQLLQTGLKQGDRVIAYGKNSDAYVLAWLAILRAGMVHVPTNFALNTEELGYVIEQSGARGLITDVSLAGTVAPLLAVTDLAFQGYFHSSAALSTDILQIALSDLPATAPNVSVIGTDLAQFLYTSGTTAAPKAAMMTHQALMAEYLACMVELDIKPHEPMLSALPLYHSAQMHVFLMPALLRGVSIRLMEKPVAEQCLALIEQENIVSFFAPPTFWIALLRHPDFDKRNLSSLQKAYYGASIMPVPILKELQQRLPNVGLYNCYGQSEIAPLATVLRPEDHELRPNSAGRPILTVETRIVDEQMKDMPVGEHGEIVHRSPQLLMGYWNDPETTDAAFTGGWFHSGDVGYLDEEGYLYIVDRIKDVINTGGIVVASREVEEVIFSHAAVAEVAVIGMPHPKWIEAITAVVIVKENVTVTADELIEHARQHLAGYKLPKRIVFSKTLPKSTAGKILKRRLREELQA